MTRTPRLVLAAAALFAAVPASAANFTYDTASNAVVIEGSIVKGDAARLSASFKKLDGDKDILVILHSPVAWSASPTRWARSSPIPRPRS